MAEELIDKYVDRTGFAEDTEFVLKELNKINAAFQALDKIRLSIDKSTGITQVITLAKEASTQLNEVSAASDKMANQLVTGGRKVSDSSKQQAAANKSLSDSYRDLLEELNRLNKEKDKTIAKIQELSDAFSKGKMSEKEYIDQLASLQLTQEELSISSSNVLKAMDSIARQSEASAGSIDELRAKLASAKQAYSEMSDSDRGSASGKALEQTITDLNNQIIRLTQSSKQLNKETIASKLEQQAYNADIKDQIRLEQSAEGSIIQKRLQLKELQKQYDALSEAQRNSDDGNDLLSRLQALDKEVKQLEGSTGRFQRRVGDYANQLAGGFDKIANEIARLKQEQKELTSFKATDPAGFAARGGDQQIRKVAGAINDLSKAQEISLRTNQSYTTTVKQLERAYVDMATSGEHSEEFLKEFAKFVAESKTQAENLTKEIKAMGSETRGFDLATGAVTTLAAGFELAAGAGAILGKETEDVEKSIRKLIAIQSVARGVQELAKQATEKTTLAGKAYNFILAQGEVLLSKTATGAQKVGAAFKGIVVLAVIGALISLVSKLSQASEASEELVDDLDDLTRQSEEAKAKLEDLNKQVEYLKRLGDINLKINFSGDFQRDILRANANMVSLQTQAVTLSDEVDKAFTRSSSASQLFFENAGRSAIEAASKFGSFADIPDEIVSEFSKKDKKLFETAKKSAETLRDFQNRLEDNRKEQIIARQETELLRVEKQREDAKKAADDAEKLAKQAKDRADKELQTQYNILQIGLQQIADFNKEIADNENRSSEERLIALRKYLYAKNVLINAQAELEKKLGYKTSSELTLIEEQRADQILRINREVVAQSIKIQKTSLKEKTKITKEEQSHLDDLAEQLLKNLQTRTDKEKEIIASLLEQRKDYTEQVKALYKTLYAEITDAAEAFFTFSDDREKQRNLDEIARIDEKKAKDIEAINQTVTDRAKAADEISIIEKRAQAQKELLEEKNRQIEKRKASVERLGKIAEIAGSTAQGIVSLTIKAAEAKAQALLLASNPATAALAPIATANAALISTQIPLISIIAAAQIAKLALPKYAEGKDKSDTYEGWSFTGDGGRSELILRSDGRMEVTPNKPTLTYVGKHDQIIPDSNLVFQMGLASMFKQGESIKSGNSQMTGDYDIGIIGAKLDKGFAMLNRTIENKKEYHFDPPSLSDRVNRVIDGNKEYYERNGFTRW